MADKTFVNDELTEEELPAFLSMAALAAKRKWKDRVGSQSQVNSPGFKPSNAQARQVAKLATCGLNVYEIGKVLCIEKSLLEFYYQYELQSSPLRTAASVGRVALKMALDGQHPDMTRFWLKTRAGWKETEVHEHTGIDAAADEAKAAREKLMGDDTPIADE